MMIRILLADDHAVVRHGLREILEAAGDMEVVGEATDGRDVVEKATVLRPDAVVMDVDMPVVDGIEATRLVVEMLPEAKVIILSMHGTQEHLYQAVRAGAQGYLLKEVAGSEVVRAVRAVVRGRRFFGAGLEADVVGGGSSRRSPYESLSRREKDVFMRVVEGRTSAEIAELLHVSPKSVETYRSRIMVKLGVDNVPALVRFAVQNGLLEDGAN